MSKPTTEDFKRNLVVEECVKANVPQIFGLHGDSNGGKSCTSMILAIGLVGPDKQVGVIDGENRRSGWAADVALDLAQKHYGKRPPNPLRIPLDDCHPLAIVAAIQTLIERGCAAIVCDAMTQSWERYLDLKEEALNRMAGDDWKKRERSAMAAAGQVKPGTHSLLVRAIRSCPVHLVMCFRGKKRVQMKRNEDGKTVIEKDQHSTPIQETGLIFDCLVAGEVVAKDGIGGYCVWRGPASKTTHPDVIKLLPGPDEQFHFRHAEALARWCSGTVTPQSQQPTNQPTTQPPDALKTLKRELLGLTADVHGIRKGDPKEIIDMGLQKLNQHLMDSTLISDSEAVETLTEERLREVIGKLKG